MAKKDTDVADTPTAPPPEPVDPFTNPILKEEPKRFNPIHPPDANSNPAAIGPIGGVGTTAPAVPGVVQTTINTDTTTIHPDSSMVNPVKPDGTPAPVKNAATEPQARAFEQAHAPDPKKK